MITVPAWLLITILAVAIFACLYAARAAMLEAALVRLRKHHREVEDEFVKLIGVELALRLDNAVLKEALKENPDPANLDAEIEQALRLVADKKSVQTEATVTKLPTQRTAEEPEPSA